MAAENIIAATKPDNAVAAQSSSSKKDKFYAKTAFILSMGAWIPLLNIGLLLASIYLAIKALKLIDAEPERYGGKVYAIIALVISVTALVMTVVTVVLFRDRLPAFIGQNITV